MVILEPGLQNILIALGVVYWLSMARIVRGQVLSLKEQDFSSRRAPSAPATGG